MLKDNAKAVSKEMKVRMKRPKLLRTYMKDYQANVKCIILSGGSSAELSHSHNETYFDENRNIQSEFWSLSYLEKDKSP